MPPDPPRVHAHMHMYTGLAPPPLLFHKYLFCPPLGSISKWRPEKEDNIVMAMGGRHMYLPVITPSPNWVKGWSLPFAQTTPLGSQFVTTTITTVMKKPMWPCDHTAPSWSQLLICSARVWRAYLVEVGSSIINFISRPLLLCYYPYVVCILFSMSSLCIFTFWMFCLHIYEHIYMYVYKYIDNFPFSAQVRHSLCSPQIISFEVGDDLCIEVSSLFSYGPACCKTFFQFTRTALPSQHDL